MPQQDLYTCGRFRLLHNGIINMMREVELSKSDNYDILLASASAFWCLWHYALKKSKPVFESHWVFIKRKVLIKETMKVSSCYFITVNPEHLNFKKKRYILFNIKMVPIRPGQQYLIVSKCSTALARVIKLWTSLPMNDFFLKFSGPKEKFDNFALRILPVCGTSK